MVAKKVVPEEDKVYLPATPPANSSVATLTSSAMNGFASVSICTDDDAQLVEMKLASRRKYTGTQLFTGFFSNANVRVW